MQLILLTKVLNLGNLGDKVNVKPGYGRNFLVPQGKATPATAANLAEFVAHPRMRPLEVGDVRDPVACRRWADEVDAIAHLAASISVQDSIDDPATTFDNDVVGTFNLLEAARSARARFLFMSTCMVYDRSTSPSGIDERHPTKPASPYAASKLAGEALTLSYHHAYGMPTTVVRPWRLPQYRAASAWRYRRCFSVVGAG